MTTLLSSSANISFRVFSYFLSSPLNIDFVISDNKQESRYGTHFGPNVCLCTDRERGRAMVVNVNLHEREIPV